MLCDFEKEFDSVDRSAHWWIMRKYNIPNKIVKMVKVMYTGSECPVFDGSEVVRLVRVQDRCEITICLGFFSCLLRTGYENDHQNWD